MNTLGLKRKINTFGLGRVGSYIVTGYHEIVNFMLKITKIFKINTKL